jgi:hypothetical protein
MGEQYSCYHPVSSYKKSYFRLNKIITDKYWVVEFVISFSYLLHILDMLILDMLILDMLILDMLILDMLILDMLILDMLIL